MVAGVAIANGGTTVTVKGGAKIQHGQRLSVDEAPTRTGDFTTALGRKSRVFNVQGSVYTHDSEATATTNVQQLRTWCDAGTTVTVTTKSETAVSCKIRDLEVIEIPAANGYEVIVVLVEVN